MEQLEVALAKAILASEPPKRKGGSKARSTWIAMALRIQLGLLDLGLDADLFRKTLLEEA